MEVLELIHAKSADLAGGVLLSDQKPTGFRLVALVTLDNFADCTVLYRRRIIQVSALSTFLSVRYWPTEVLTGNGESGFDSGEGA